MRKRILLTGATGFVGRQILSALLKADVDLRLVIRNGSESRLPQTGVSEIMRTADLFKESAEWWAAACQGVDVVVHAAWYAEPGVYMQSLKNFECLAGTLQLAIGCAQAGVRRVVGIGSCAEYDISATAIVGGGTTYTGEVLSGSGSVRGQAFAQADFRNPLVLSKIDSLAASQLPISIVCTSVGAASSIRAGMNWHEQTV
jgi:nucleoside-diphosphate-sugar epimerase